MTPEELSQHTHDGMMNHALSSVAAIFEGDGWSTCDALRAANGLMEPAFRAWGELMDRVMADDKRIRDLEAELAVRDNMGNEVLRILREATGKRDFHSEMEAAKYAAEIIRESGWRPIAEAPEGVGLFLGAYGEMGTWCSYGPAQKDFAIRCGYTHYLPEPAPPAREVENG